MVAVKSKLLYYGVRLMKMRLIMESFRAFVNEDKERPMQEVPQNIFHAVGSDQLANLRDNGITNLPTELDFEEGKAGVPCTTDMMGARKHGDVVLELDGPAMMESGQYTLNQSGDAGVRLGMTDSAYTSGHGVHDMVDKLGTNIPFQFVKRMIFSGDSLPNVRKLKEDGFAGVEIATFSPNEESDEPQVMWSPPPLEEQ